MDVMFDLVMALPDQIAEGREIARDFDLRLRRVTNLVYCGVGDSAMGGDFLWSLAAGSLNIPLTIVRHYQVPGWVGRDSLVIAASYSGSTQETLSAYNKAKEQGAQILALTSGGKLEKLALKDGFQILKVPPGPSSRAALGYMTIPLLAVLGKLKLFEFLFQDIEEAEEVAREQLSRPIEDLARFVYGGIPLIYGSQGITAAAALRWKAQLNENAKHLAFCNSYPEQNHNEIVGFEFPREQAKLLRVINLVSSHDHPGNRKRAEITAQLLADQGIETFTVTAQGISPLAQLFSLVAAGDLLSLRLAELMEVAPSPTKTIDELKKNMNT